MKYSASIRIDFASRRDAENALAAISHEGKESGRAVAETGLSGRTLEIAIRAKDATAFRAFINSFLRDFQALEGIVAENAD